MGKAEEASVLLGLEALLWATERRTYIVLQIQSVCLVSPKSKLETEIRDTLRCGSNPGHQAIWYKSCMPGEFSGFDK